MNVQNILVMACAVALAGCGGSDDPVQPPTQPQPQALAKFNGNWRTACDNHRVIALVVQESQGIVLPQYTHTYYANADCTGSVVATGVFGALGTSPNPYDWRYDGPAAGSNVRMQDGTIVTIDADRIKVGQTNSQLGFTGTGVTVVTVGALARTAYKIDYVGGTVTVLLQTQGGNAPLDRALAIRNGELLELTPTGVALPNYSVEVRYMRQVP